MIAALIQARVGSERLPGKVLKEIPKGSGVSILARVIRRLKICEMIDDIIVVTPNSECAAIAENEGVKSSKLIQGQRDVIAEFYYAAQKFNVDTIVRITADCPCICPEMVDKIVRIHLYDGGKDLTYNRNDNLYYCAEIDGLDVEVFSFDALCQAYLHAKEPADKEHVTKWMYKNLKTDMVECGWHIENAGEIKLSVDRQEDYERICTIYEVLGPDFNMRQLQGYFEKEIQGEIMSEYTIRIIVEIPDYIKRDKITEWANYVTGFHPFLPADNPLMGTDLEAIYCSLETR